MIVAAFEGAAGTGKTHRLMEELRREVAGRALCAHERVLALTFMHGARSRLDSRLREIDEIQGRFHATTLDSFAWRLCQRWRLLVASLGHVIPGEHDFDATCDLAATLLDRSDVRAWVSASYPVAVVDEAQDLSSERSMIVERMAGTCRVLLAFDEFQCLDPNLRPLPLWAWLLEVCVPTRLDRCWRTDDAEFLEAAHSVRGQRAVRVNGRRFKVAVTPGRPNLAATYLANFIAWRRGGSVAVLTPSRSGGFSDAVVQLVCEGPVGRQQNGPFPIRWESTDSAQRDAICREIAMPGLSTVADALARLDRHSHLPAVRNAMKWIQRRHRVTGSDDVTADDVRRHIDRAFAAQRRHKSRFDGQFTAMTIQQAKNREFDHVVVVCPYRVPNDEERKRRLLYNAITRARRSCLVLVQGHELVEMPPFVG